MSALLSRVVPMLNKALPAGLAVNGLKKISPKIASFATNAASVGYSTDAILDYLRHLTQSEGENQEEERLKKGQSQGQLRPDEKTSLNKRKVPEKLLKVASLAAGLGSGLEAIAGEESEEEQMQPQEPSAIQKQPPSFQQGKQPPPFQASQPQQQQQQALPQAQGNQPVQFDFIQERLQPLAQAEPNIASEIEKMIKNGQSPEAAAAVLKTSSAYGKLIRDLERNYFKQDFVDFVTSLFGSGQKPSQQPQPGQSNRGQGSAQINNLMQAVKQGTAIIQKISGQ